MRCCTLDGWIEEEPEEVLCNGKRVLRTSEGKKYRLVLRRKTKYYWRLYENKKNGGNSCESV